MSNARKASSSINHSFSTFSSVLKLKRRLLSRERAYFRHYGIYANAPIFKIILTDPQANRQQVCKPVGYPFP